MGGEAGGRGPSPAVVGGVVVVVLVVVAAVVVVVVVAVLVRRRRQRKWEAPKQPPLPSLDNPVYSGSVHLHSCELLV